MKQSDFNKACRANVDKHLASLGFKEDCSMRQALAMMNLDDLLLTDDSSVTDDLALKGAILEMLKLEHSLQQGVGKVDVFKEGQKRGVEQCLYFLRKALGQDHFPRIRRDEYRETCDYCERGDVQNGHAHNCRNNPRLINSDELEEAQPEQWTVGCFNADYQAEDRQAMKTSGHFKTREECQSHCDELNTEGGSK